MAAGRRICAVLPPARRGKFGAMILKTGHILIPTLLCMALSACALEPPRHETASTWQTKVELEPEEPAPVATAFKTAAIPVQRPVAPPQQARKQPPKPHELRGIASYYWQEQKTASGERFDKYALTAAHRTLPFGTRVRVTNRNNGKSVIVRINDRGPFKPGRVIDLSLAAAGAIGMRSLGLAPVAVEVLP
jgi:rare lipoprotein A